MDQESLSQLIEISRAVGSDPEYVQAGGGNTSVKSPDGQTMAIKASGTPLAKMSPSAGWVEMDIARTLTLFGRRELATMAVNEREACVAEHLATAAISKGRPSVESALHAFLGKVVIHTHPVAVNALTCGPGEKALREITHRDEPAPLWIPYTDPGWSLAVTVKSAVDGYAEKHGYPPAVLFLENHGIFVSSKNAQEALALHRDWVERCAKYFSLAALPLPAVAQIDSARLRKVMAELRRSWHELRGTATFTRWSANIELAGVATSDSMRTLASGALTPDVIVYAGAHAVLAESIEELPAQLKAAMGGKTSPRVAIVRNTGSFLLADDAVKLEAAEELAAYAAKVVRLAATRGGARNLSPEATDFILNWEAEHYRASLMESKPAPLAGKVALVTGAASGLGCGIAQGMVDAGAAVAFCDVDEPGLAEAVAASGEPRRALALRMDVTNEESVTAAFDGVVRHWGGLDIVVCAAGIAPAFNLVDFPVNKWRLALEINLTGYFLAAREGARIMQVQGSGGAMIMLSSKSGLDASKANSAYNATKAGELHLMRGWALELGPDQIRVNAIAPGNVIAGSKLWNEDYIKAAAVKKGIKPEEVIPYYNSLTALKREIKRADIAAATVFLCSDQARCITGQTLVVDSGQVFVR